MDESYYRLHADLEESYWWFVAKNRIILALIERYGPRSGDACDIGCGAGGLLQRLPVKFHAVGIDMSPLALGYCADRGLRALPGSLPDDLPLQAASFDVVVASEVIEHVADDRGAVRRLAALLKPGGILVCTVPAHQWLWSRHDDLNHHQRRYTRRSFARLFEGIPLERLTLGYYQMWLFPLMVAARLADRLRPGSSDADDAPVEHIPRPLNAAFTAAFASERHLIGRVPLPIGGSVISVHRRSA